MMKYGTEEEEEKDEYKNKGHILDTYRLNRRNAKKNTKHKDTFIGQNLLINNNKSN